MTEQAVEQIEHRVRSRREEAVAEAQRHRDAAEAESHAASVAYHKAFDAWEKKETPETTRRFDAAFNRAISATAAAKSARDRLAALTDPYAFERQVELEREKKVREAERRERERAEREAERESAPKKRSSVTVKTIETGARHYPTVKDTGDGLAALDRGRLRSLAKAAGVSVGGHKATLVARLREAGVTA